VGRRKEEKGMEGGMEMGAIGGRNIWPNRYWPTPTPHRNYIILGRIGLWMERVEGWKGST
jgi:hypothetical protein